MVGEVASMGPLFRSKKLWKQNIIGIVWYQNACCKTDFLFHSTNLG